MDANAMDLHGQSLRDFYNGDFSSKVVVRREDGYVSDLPVRRFFRQPEDCSPLERTALDLCRGDVLDIGAGAGCHSLALQERGMTVRAIDISPSAVEVMMRRGVRHVRCMDIFELDGERYDTLLMMMHGLGLVADLSGLDRFLLHVRRLVRAEGQILCDSLDVRHTEDPLHLAYQEANLQAGHSAGEIRMQFEYKGQTGPFFSWLQVDPQTLGEHAERMGWCCRVVCQEESGDYLAQLTPDGPGR